MKHGWALWLGLLASGCLREDIELFPSAGSGRADGGAGAACTGQSYRVAHKGLEILILADASLTALLPMGPLECVLGSVCRAFWDITVAEIERFVYDPRSIGISVALRYFGSGCDPRSFENPDVPMGVLPEHAATISQSLRATLPFGAETATRPALEGALTYARTRTQSPGYNARMIVVLLADEPPVQTDCENNDVAALARVAAAGSAFDPPVSTYVFVTSSVTLDAVAQAGGTERSIFVDPALGNFSSALNGLRERELGALPCEYTLPEAYRTHFDDPQRVNLRHDGVPVGRVSGESACKEGQGGWYYDDRDAPARILACPSTCRALRQGGTVDIQLDCPTVVLL